MKPERSQEASQRIGTLMHRLLQQWNFQWAPENFHDHLAEFCQRHLSWDLNEGHVEWNKELEMLLDRFLHSSAYRELQRSTILGREVPFAVPWPTSSQESFMPQACVMEGVMDVVYEIDGEVWVGDYKTDHVTVSTVARRAEVYREQAHAYATAASQCLGSMVKGCKLFFVRIGEVIPVELLPTGNIPFPRKHD